MWVYSLPPLCVVFSGLATVPDCLQITNGAKLAGGLFYRAGATLEASGFFVRWSSLDLITFLYSGVSCSYNPLPVFSFLCLQFLFVSMLPALTPGPRLLFTSFPPPCAVLLLSWWLSPTFLKFRDRLPFQRLTFFVGISYGAQSVFVEEIPGSSADMLPIYKAVSYILILPAVNGGRRLCVGSVSSGAVLVFRCLGPVFPLVRSENLLRIVYTVRRAPVPFSLAFVRRFVFVSPCSLDLTIIYHCASIKTSRKSEQKI